MKEQLQLATAVALHQRNEGTRELLLLVARKQARGRNASARARAGTRGRKQEQTTGGCASDCLHGLHRLVKGVIELAILRDAASQHRLEVGQIADVDDLVDAVDERAHGVVRREAMR